ncbi:Uncharacterised protein [Mycolicibacterium chitae]|uniref:Uncharacterized protein n=1 Tax=Mycolicibacterium chitae TaxID=1792 RepID=A0A3S4VB44_MYCCI|nr:Uncharacterised protein [Mycolicibacterium chitae]
MSRRNRRNQPGLRCSRGHRTPHLGTCPTGKIRFPDHTAAVHALHSAATQRNFAEQDGTVTNRREVRSYSCKECKGWHVTSKPMRQTRPAPPGQCKGDAELPLRSHRNE